MGVVAISVKAVGVRVVLTPKSVLDGHPVRLETIQSKVSSLLGSLGERWQEWRAAASLADQKSLGRGWVEERARRDQGPKSVRRFYLTIVVGVRPVVSVCS